MLSEPWVLGLLAGATVFLGFPVALWRELSPKARGFLNAASTGILIFLLIEITGHLLEDIDHLVERVAAGQPGVYELVARVGVFVAGLSGGLLGLVWFEKRFLGAARNMAPARRSRRVSLMIAAGLGLHNFSEGLAIGQGIAGGAFQLAWLLAIGFALHNATEGFGIAAPLAGHAVDRRFLLRAGLIAGTPTFLGSVIGGSWSHPLLEVFCLALASGTILYVVGELLHMARQLKAEGPVEVGLLTGFFVAVFTDLFLAGAMAHMTAQAETPLIAESSREPDGLEMLHRPRHGGYFGDADDLYHYEVLLNEHGQLVLYVNDDLNRPLDVRPLQGRWALDRDSGGPDGVFVAARDGRYFYAELPPKDKPLLYLEVAVLKGTQWAAMEFYVPDTRPEGPEALSHVPSQSPVGGL